MQFYILQRTDTLNNLDRIFFGIEELLRSKKRVHSTLGVSSASQTIEASFAFSGIPELPLRYNIRMSTI